MITATNKNSKIIYHVINLRVKYTTISKRNMIPWLNRLAQKKSITYTNLYTPKNRQFATANWTYKIRIEPPAKKNEEKPNIIVTDKKRDLK